MATIKKFKNQSEIDLVENLFKILENNELMTIESENKK